MGNELQKSFGAKSQKSMPMFDPEDLVLVTDKAHPLYDERVEWPVDDALVKNIMVHGVIQPVVVRKNGQRKNGSPIVEVVEGRQRVKACIEANKRLAAEGSSLIRVPAITRGGDDVSLMGVMISSNELRRGDELIVKAKKAQRLLDQGATEEEVAIQFGVSVATIKNYLALLECDKSILTAVASGELTADSARKLAKLSREEQKATLEKMRKKGAMKGQKAGRVVQEATGQPAKGGMGKKQIKRILHNLLGAEKESEDESEKGKYAFGATLLQHILGDRAEQPFENPRTGAMTSSEESSETKGDDTLTRDQIMSKTVTKGKRRGRRKSSK